MKKKANWLFLASIYLVWGLLTWSHDLLTWWMLVPIGATLIAWHGSFQHEAVHGHLASPARLNELLAYPPLSLWIPLPIYKQSHRAHHHFDILTDPHRDPESFYIDPQDWQALPSPIRHVLVWQKTFPGRLILGPFLVIGQFLYSEARALWLGDHRHLTIWLWHLVGITIIITWVTIICGMPIWHYLLFFVLPGTSLTLIRSFAEHLAAHTPYERTAIVEAGPFFSLLFLNNNLHFVHHKRPDLPWQALPDYYRKHRHQMLEENGHLHYRGGYGEISRRFLLQPIDHPQHPFL